MSRLVWVVRGSAGCYSDRSEWPVRAFASEDAAFRHAALCTERVREARERAVREDIDAYGEMTEEVARFVSEYDPSLVRQYEHATSGARSYWLRVSSTMAYADDGPWYEVESVLMEDAS